MDELFVNTVVTSWKQIVNRLDGNSLGEPNCRDQRG